MKQKQYLERASYTWSEDSVRMIETTSNVAKTAYFYVQEIGYFKTRQPYFTERENLDSFLVIYTIAGRGKLKYRGVEYETGPGQCFYIYCQEHHYYQAVGDEEWEFVWVHFNGSSALGYYRQFDSNGFRILNCGETKTEELIREMIRVNQKKNLTTEIVTSNLIHNLITELLIQNCTNNCMNNRIDDTGGIFIPEFVKEIAKEIECRFKEPLCLEEFERKYNRSRYHIAKEFKKYIGVTVNEYIIISRISYAKELLRYSELSVGEIAFETGMNNVTHFINLFKARENTTPLAYRKEWRN